MPLSPGAYSWPGSTPRVATPQQLWTCRIFRGALPVLVNVNCPVRLVSVPTSPRSRMGFLDGDLRGQHGHLDFHRLDRLGLLSLLSRNWTAARGLRPPGLSPPTPHSGSPSAPQPADKATQPQIRTVNSPLFAGQSPREFRSFASFMHSQIRIWLRIFLVETYCILGWFRQARSSTSSQAKGPKLKNSC